MDSSELIRLIDPSLRFVQKIGPRMVYRVEHQGQNYVLKAMSLGDIYSYEIDNEVGVSERSRDLEGITHVIKHYSSEEGYVAVLKEFVEGKSLLESDGKLTQELWEQLKHTVDELHQREVSYLDLAKRNIVISPDNSRATLVDLGTCWFGGVRPLIAFTEGIDEDNRLLNWLKDN